MVASSQRGFTLVEILVAMIILSSVTLIAANAFSLFSTRWDGRLGRFDDTLKTAKTRLLVQEILENITPYVATSIDGKQRLFFEGNRNGFVAVSLTSLRDPSVPAVIRLSAIQQADFSYRLTYEEWPMSQRLLLQSGVALDFDPPIVLYSRLKDVQFQYFGAPAQSQLDDLERAQQELGVPPRWLPQYNSLATFRQPEKIDIRWLTADATEYVQQSVVLIRPTPGQTSRTTEGEF